MAQGPAIRTAFRTLSAAAPPLAVELGFRAFRRVGPPAPVRPADQDVHARARRGAVVVHGHHVVTYAWGDPATRPVLLVHGWQLRASRFAALVRALEASGLRPVAFDGLAHGESGGRWTTVVEHMAVMRAVQQAEGRFAGVVGHSLGGLAAGLALHDGFAADRFAAVAAPVGFDTVTGTFMKLAGIPVHLEDRLRRRIGRGLVPDLADPRTTLDLAVNPVPDRVPTLFVQDRADVLSGPDQARRLHAAHPGSELLLTDGLGHNRILDDPDVVQAVVTHMTAGVRTPAA